MALKEFIEKQEENNQIKYYSSDSKLLFRISFLSIFLIILIGIILLDSFLDRSTITGMAISVKARETIALSSDLSLVFIIIVIITYVFVRIIQREAE